MQADKTILSQNDSVCITDLGKAMFSIGTEKDKKNRPKIDNYVVMFGQKISYQFKYGCCLSLKQVFKTIWKLEETMFTNTMNRSNCSAFFSYSNNYCKF